MTTLTLAEPLTEVRCPACNKLLFKAALTAMFPLGSIEVKCRCNALVRWPVLAAVIVPVRDTDSLPSTPVTHELAPLDNVEKVCYNADSDAVAADAA